MLLSVTVKASQSAWLAPVVRLALNDFGKRLYDKFGMVDKQKINPEEMCFVEENDKVKLKFVFFGMYGEKDVSSDSININSMEFYILVKVN
jgi:hypothetical protein